MRDTFLPLSRPSFEENDILSVAEVMRSGWITTGPKAMEFEQKFSEYVGADQGVAVCSGTAGMHLALATLDIGPGDEVITPSLTWVSTVNLIVLAGATPVFADIDRHTLMVTSKTIEEKITDRTKLIIPVHFAGSAVDMSPIRKLASKRGITILEDAAHATGTLYQSKPVGSSGHAVFSFHAIKNLTTGEGGMVCSNDSEFIKKVKVLKFHGLGIDSFDRQTQGRKPQAEVLTPGYKYNMTDIAAAMGLNQLARIDRLNERRCELTRYYRQKLCSVDGIRLLDAPDYDVQDSCHLMIIRLTSDRIGRQSFMAGLKERNIGSGIHFKAVHQQKYYRENGFEVSLPHTEWNSRRILSLPLFPDMRPGDVDDVVQAIKEVLSK
jgi:UDP-4-amino-4-deoxy-L-arabinose-oxoglutarate aminotransferase